MLLLVVTIFLSFIVYIMYDAYASEEFKIFVRAVLNIVLAYFLVSLFDGILFLSKQHFSWSYWFDMIESFKY